jgi:coenzyme F420 hydrogenase subunit beta
MLGRQVKTLQDVVDWGLCTGCGACSYMCRKGAVRLVNVAGQGIRPRIDTAQCADCKECLSVCPGYQVDGGLLVRELETPPPAETPFGVALEIWEGHATDPEIRHKASSGGLLTALALHCLEEEGMEQVIHVGADGGQPWLNKTIRSRTRGEMLAATGSRYAPASPCDRLGDIEAGGGQSVFIGKPCDTAAAMMARRQRPELDAKLGLVLAFFCAGAPSTNATLDLLKAMGIAPETVKRLIYRGEGWPGGFKVQIEGQVKPKFIPYMESWGELAKQRPFRCHLCPDGLGRLADLACGDAWEKFTGNGNEGLSLVLVRTERGREILHRAMTAGRVKLRRVGVREVLRAQVNLLERRTQIHGRLLGMKLLGVPTPRLKGFQLSRDWWRLPAKEKARTVLGTMRRIVRRGLWRRAKSAAFEEAPANFDAGALSARRTGHPANPVFDRERTAAKG